MNRFALVITLVLALSCTEQNKLINGTDSSYGEHLINDSIVVNTSLLDSVCLHLEAFVVKSNWRKHSSNNCYVVDRNVGFGFVNSVYQFKECGRTITISKLLDIFGMPLDIDINSEGLIILSYPFVVNASTPMHKQNIGRFFICIDDRNCIFPLDLSIDEYPLEPIDD